MGGNRKKRVLDRLNVCLQESNGSTEQALYKRMVTFAEDDPAVLSRDYSVHLSKMLSENYAFISTTFILDIWASEHCDITVLPVKLTGLEYYSVLLPKDSALTGQINDVYVLLSGRTIVSVSLNFTLSVCRKQGV